MKRILIVLLLPLLLCGCKTEESEYLVSSMGFYYESGLFEVCFEAVVVNSENTEQQVKLFYGNGETIEEAVSVIKKQCTRPLLISHCGVIAIGDTMERDKFLQVCDFCYDVEEITLSAFFIKTENPKILLSAKPLASVCVGYDVMGLLKQNKSQKNRFFEVIKSGYDFNLPRVSLKQGGIIFDS